MLLHSIGRTGPPYATSAFIRKHIFPGGYIPALSEVLPAVEKSGLMVTDVEILRLHYAETLKHWRQRFLANREHIRRSMTSVSVGCGSVTWPHPKPPSDGRTRWFSSSNLR